MGERDERDELMHDLGYFHDCPDADCPMPYECSDAGRCLRESAGAVSTYEDDDDA